MRLQVQRFSDIMQNIHYIGSGRAASGLFTERGIKVMSLESVQAYFQSVGLGDRVKVFTVSSATVELAAKAAGVIPARIAKSLSFKVDDKPILIVAAGDAKVDNSKYKAKFKTKAKMLTPDEAIELVGHAVGGVCPFALKDGVSVYLDESLRRFDTVFPAAGSDNSAVELSCDELFEHSGALEWVDLCKGWRDE